ncbi:aspartyl protease family protein 2-like [Aegilops tauschii subsp. strangulata]|uniref:aspartyl protease family protein 2-like n=1 Tax=Aegilops tauschii subsp. strangulata TaxID=200361 RepID=UPI001E1C9DF7|nr:aspartyl protease family protein 2-like [Aegilops tauschii subsp. strangulata]
MDLCNHALLLHLVLAALLHPAVVVAVDDATSGRSKGFSLRLVPSPGWNSTIHVDDDGFVHLNEPVEHAPNVLRPHMPHKERYNIITTVGTGHGRRTYTLAMEMTQSLTWMQCVPIQNPFQQVSPPFNPTASPSFHPLAPTNHLCSPPGGSLCRFRSNPMFLSVASASAVEPAVVIGCAHISKCFRSHGVLAGILALGKTYLSLIWLLGRGGLHSFSYCLFFPQGNRHGFLRFGSDIPVDTRHMKSTRLLYPEASAYYVNLAGISFGRTWLGGNLTEVLRRRKLADGSWHSGCVLDTGMFWGGTFMIRHAYDILEHALVEHGRRLGVPRVPRHNFGLCFRVTWAILSHWPTVTLHFESEQDLVLTPKKLFVLQDQDMCLTVKPNPQITVIGPATQVGTRFVYDLAASRVYFAPENCNADTGV